MNDTISTDDVYKDLLMKKSEKSTPNLTLLYVIICCIFYLSLLIVISLLGKICLIKIKNFLMHKDAIGKKLKLNNRNNKHFFMCNFFSRL